MLIEFICFILLFVVFMRRSSVENKSITVGDDDGRDFDSVYGKKCHGQGVIAKLSDWQKCTSFIIKDGNINKTNFDDLFDEIDNIMVKNDQGYYVTEIITFDDGELYGPNAYLSFLNQAYNSLKSQSADVVFIGNIRCFFLSTNTYYLFGCESIRNGFEQIISIYEFTKSEILTNMHDLAYDCLKIRILEALNSDFKNVVLEQQDVKKSASLAVNKMLSTANNLTDNVKTPGDYDLVQHYNPVGLNNLITQIENFQLGVIKCDHLRNKSDIVTCIFKFTHHFYLEEFKSCMREIVSRYVAILNTTENIAELERGYIFCLDKFQSLYTEGDQEASLILNRHFSNFNLIKYDEIFRPYFISMLPELTVLTQKERDTLCRQYKIHNITRVVSENQFFSTNNLEALSKIITGKNSKTDSVVKRSLASGEKVREVERRTGNKKTNGPIVAGVRYDCDYYNEIEYAQGNFEKSKQESERLNPSPMD